MGRILLVLLLFYFHVDSSLSTLPSSSLNSTPLCHPGESSVLLQLKSNLSLDLNNEYPYHCGTYPKTNSWNETTNCCLWEGVTCDKLTAHVVALDLNCSWLIGSLPANNSFLPQRLQRLNLAENNLNGSISSALFSQLVSLTHLDLSSNQFSGSISSGVFGQLVSLTHLDLSSNQFSGSIPSAFFSQLVSLTHLDVSSNRFSGLVPSEISLLSQLVSLRLSQFEADYTLTLDKHSFDLLASNLTELTNLVLDGLDMSGVPPSSLLNLTSSLKYSSLYLLNLNGELPSDFFRFPNLQYLDLSNNDGITGYLPKSNWSSPLEFLDLAYCNFGGSLPASLGELTQISLLDLSENSFGGRIPDVFGSLKEINTLKLSSSNFGGQIPAAIFNHAKITHLDRSNNSLDCVLPAHVSGLQNLEELDLSSNRISGGVPSWLFTLSSLKDLYLSNNRLLSIPTLLGLPNNSREGVLPAQNLEILNLSYNFMRGGVPSWLFTLLSPTSIDLSQNSLEGVLPADVDELQNLRSLDLSYNVISGGVPSWLFTLPSLTDLCLSNNRLVLSIQTTDDQIKKPNSIRRVDLSSNDIHGLLPSFFFDLVNLTELDLSSNNLSGVITSQMLEKFKSLERLHLSNNSLLSLSSSYTDVNYTFNELDTLSLSSCNISRFPSFLKTAKKLSTLDLSNNKIEGSISKRESEGWEQLTSLNLSCNSLSSFEQYPGQNLQILDVRSNHLHGPVLAPPPSLQKLIISDNNLTGEIPTLICNLSYLEVLDLSINNLGGIIPVCLANSSSLSNIDLQLNNFHGQIPPFDSFTVQSLALNDNQLEGLLPRPLVNCTSLRFLNVANNKLNDTFPHWLGILPELQVLVLRSNTFHGPLENALAPYSFPRLEIFDLSQNEFTGTLPAKLLKNLTAMKFKYTAKLAANCGSFDRFCSHDDNDHKSVKVVMKRLQVELQLAGTLQGFTYIDFSSNQFYGRIPDVLGELSSLHVLNLSYNQLSGSIPPLLGHMTALESLDLSSNKLSGRIPSDLTDLTSLEVLDLSQNNLVGAIPQGKQFNTFESDSYSGNPGLWGCPLPKKCPIIRQPPPSSIVDQDGDDDDDSRIAFIWKVAMMGYGCGVVLGLSMGYIIFTTGRPWWIVGKIERNWQTNVTNWIRRIQGRRNCESRGRRN